MVDNTLGATRNLPCYLELTFGWYQGILKCFVSDVDISPTILTDHKAISVKLKLWNNRVFNYWKFSNSLLENEELITSKKCILKYWKYASINNEYWKYLELQKFYIRKLAIQVGKKVAKQKRSRVDNIIKDITDLILSQNASDDTLAMSMERLQNELDDIYINWAKILYYLDENG